jgi:hypothetical protein
MASGTTRYRKAHTAGATGAKLPEGLASMADSDPKIDLAHDAGRNGTSFDDFASEHLTEKPKGEPKTRPPSPKSTRRSVPTPGRPSLRRPLGANVPVGSGPGIGLAGVFLGAIAYALILSVVDYGTAGPGMWLKAKFINEGSSSSSGVAAGFGTAAQSAAQASGGVTADTAATANYTPAQKALAAQMAAAAAAGGA